MNQLLPASGPVPPHVDVPNAMLPMIIVLIATIPIHYILGRGVSRLGFGGLNPGLLLPTHATMQ